MSSLASNMHCISITKEAIVHYRDNIDALLRGIGFRLRTNSQKEVLLKLNQRCLLEAESQLRFSYRNRVQLMKGSNESAGK